MRPKNLDPVHPGAVLAEDFLKPLGITQSKLAGHVGVTVQRVNEIINGRRGISPETAWLLAQAFGTSPKFWLNLQNQYDLATKRPKRRIRKLAAVR
ncbi:MAG: HigA family addiction module antitoxin [Planctomycetota bacterium]|jgi:addiction module HigA family antidote